MIFEIKNRWSTSVLFSVKAKSLRIAAELAVEGGADLCEADLCGADLCEADFVEPIFVELIFVKPILIFLSGH